MKSNRYDREIKVAFTAKSDKEANQKMVELIVLAANKGMILTSIGKLKKLPF